jgi:hypothetical protein
MVLHEPAYTEMRATPSAGSIAELKPELASDGLLCYLIFRQDSQC